ncbi:hypothetical protein DICPUDRAFT_147724 [Dictyostelium purpureum]|uniref:PH domain-containing protein n=1 Tax=Dictyostelium purpureum TaxID=5786 RepID=F0Z984_DICPU|nr:uncharacterized protein DICPUDRAFT_147724 [Dictyostelium purpureum]EGC39507.1 hypothetical protein DICPUDRAFT_147724 [Dictyostelium purpureum]|eukprot:XP_003283954.1 hypothetical protein DICPUDRAFT_147724 [Dictyostelium purpureum]
MFDEILFLNVQRSIGSDTSNWELKYVKIDSTKIYFYDNEDSGEPTNQFNLSDIILLEEDDNINDSNNNYKKSHRNNSNNIESINNNNETSISIDSINNYNERTIELDSSISFTKNNESQILLKFKEKLGSSNEWSIEMQSEEQLSNWLKAIHNKQTPTPSNTAYSSYKGSSYYEDSDSCSCSFSSVKFKAITSTAFVVYTIVLAVLFAVLWIYFVEPIIGVDEMKTSCLINSNSWSWRSKGIYVLKISVTYEVENGEVLTNTMDQFCYGSFCPLTVNDKYPKGDNKTCYYDKNDTSYVYFSIGPMVRYRLSVTLGLCGSMFGIWLIWVIIYK